MGFISTDIEGLYVFEPQIFSDDRGYFYESFRADAVERLGFVHPFIQDNQSFSTKGTLRGLHLQLGVYSQSKIVRVLQGEVQDVVVDVRPGSPTYGMSYSVNLSAHNHRQLLIPRNFAHGFLVLSETAVFCYKCDNYYHKASESGLRYDDPDLGIEWLTEVNIDLINGKDLELPTLEAFKAQQQSTFTV